LRLTMRPTCTTSCSTPSLSDESPAPDLIKVSLVTSCLNHTRFLVLADESLFDAELLDLVRQFRLVVTRFHLRYEDDYFADVGRPYSFGLLVDAFKCNTGADSQEKRVHKQVSVVNARVYWNSLSEMFIPTTLWE